VNVADSKRIRGGQHFDEGQPANPFWDDSATANVCCDLALMIAAFGVTDDVTLP